MALYDSLCLYWRRCGRLPHVVVGNGAIHISTGDGMVGYGVVDTYCEGY